MEEEAPVVIQRDALVEDLLAASARVVVVRGVSGAGKSTLIQQALMAVAKDRHSCEPFNLMYSSSLLQLVLRGFSQILTQVINEQGTAERVAVRVASVFKRIADDRGREFAAAAGKELLGVVRQRLGPEVGKAIVDAVQAMRDETAESLAVRLDRAQPETALDIMVSFAEEVVHAANGKPVLLVLDRGNQLNEENLRLLMDLAEVLPSGAQIWVGAKDGPMVDLMEQTDATSVIVPPLSSEAIEGVLEARGLPPEDASDVIRSTGGTAMDVEAYASLRITTSVSDMPADVVTADTLAKLRAASSSARHLATRLALLSIPLPADRMAALLDDPTQSSQVLEELRSIGLLPNTDSTDWMHERRREAIRSGVSANELDAAATDVVHAIDAYLQEGAEDLWFLELASVARDATGLAEEDITIGHVLSMDRGEVAIVAGLIELDEEQHGVPVSDGVALLNYVRLVFPTDEREFEHLAALEQKEMVAVARDQRRSAVVLNISALATGIALGRAASLLDKLPVPAIATGAFQQAVIPRLGRYIDGHFGVGNPSLEELSRMASGRPEGASAVWNQSNPALVMRGAALGRRFYGAFRFGDTRTRDTALDALTGVETEFLEGRVSIATAMAYPMGPVPQDRFLNAAARALGRKPKMASDAIQEPLSHRLTAQEYAELRVETRKLLREMSGALMRGAMRLELPYSLHLLLSDNSLLEAEVRGGREIAQTHTNIDLPLTAWQMDGFDFYHLARTLSLLPGETIGRIHHSGFLDPEMGPIRFDPVLSEIGATRRRAIEFNKTQPYRKVEYGAALEREISDAFFQEMKDARALTTLPLDGVAGREISPTARYVILPRDPEHEDATERWFTWIDVYPESGVDECHVLYVEPTTDVAQFAVWSDSDMPSELRDQLPSFDYAQVNHGSTSDLRRIVAELLAVDENRLTIEY